MCIQPQHKGFFPRATDIDLWSVHRALRHSITFAYCAVRCSTVQREMDLKALLETINKGLSGDE